MRFVLPLVVLAALTAACASEGRGLRLGPDPAAVRGQRFAERACAGCHAIGAAGESPNPGSPTFRSIRLRYAEPTLRQKLAELSRDGHYLMPPIYMGPTEIEEIAAYVQTVGEGR